MIASAGRRTLLDRMMGAALLEPETYEQAALDPSTRTHAALVVIVTSIAAGLGSVGAGLTGIVLATIAALVGWGVYAYLIYWTATKRYGVPRTFTIWNATLRVLGLAHSPRIFLVFMIVPGMGFLVGLAVHTWVLITTIPAVKTALDLDTRSAVATAVAGWLPMLALWALITMLIF